MKLGGRIGAAVEILADIEARHRPVNDALKDWGVSHRFAGSADRGVIGNVVYDALRWRLSAGWIMDDASARAAVLVTIAVRWALGADGVRAALAESLHGPPPLTDAEAARLDGADLSAAPDHVRADLPEWLAPSLQRVFATDWIAEGAALATRPPLDLRANTLKADRPKVGKALARFNTVEAPLSPVGLRIGATTGEGRHPNVLAEPAFQKGWCEVQDEGSQLVALLGGARAGMQVLDLCAGAGGKTLALAAAMGGKGRVVATDSDRTRLAPIFERVKRAAAHNVEVRAARARLDDLTERMDVVLVDAPCTGSGTWRRRPDTKWRLTGRALASRTSEQDAVLAAAARYVKPGGRLVYATCSVLPEENEDRIAAFIAAQPAFAPLALADATAAIGAALATRALERPGGMVLTPHRTGTDGFFVSVLRRD